MYSVHISVAQLSVYRARWLKRQRFRHIGEVPGLNLGRDTEHPDVSRDFPRFLHAISRKEPQSGHARFLP